MELVLLILLLVTAAMTGLWYGRRRKKSREARKNPLYTCPVCGDRHCICYLEDKHDS